MKSHITLPLLFAATLALSACVSQGTYNKEEQKADTYQQLDNQLKGEVSSDQAQITQLQGMVRVTLANGILFPEGGWELNADGKQTLGKLAPVLKTLTGHEGMVEAVIFQPVWLALRNVTLNPVVPCARCRFTLAGDVVAYWSVTRMPARTVGTALVETGL